MYDNPGNKMIKRKKSRCIDSKIRKIAQKYGKDGKSASQFFKSFVDDLIHIFSDTTKQLHQLYEEMTKIHHTLKFTMEHTSPNNEPDCDRCDCERKIQYRSH